MQMGAATSSGQKTGGGKRNSFSKVANVAHNLFSCNTVNEVHMAAVFHPMELQVGVPQQLPCAPQRRLRGQASPAAQTRSWGDRENQPCCRQHRWGIFHSSRHLLPLRVGTSWKSLSTSASSWPTAKLILVFKQAPGTERLPAWSPLILVSSTCFNTHTELAASSKAISLL